MNTEMPEVIYAKEIENVNPQPYDGIWSEDNKHRDKIAYIRADILDKFREVAEKLLRTLENEIFISGTLGYYTDKFSTALEKLPQN